jgi:hypothetical protein
MVVSPYKPQFPKEVVDTKSYQGHVTVGDKGAGKSAKGEAVAEDFHHAGVVVCDLIDANDGEALFWGIPHRKTGNYYPTLLIHPPTYEVNHTRGYHHIKPMCSDQGLYNILKTAKKEKRIVTVACWLWQSGTVGNMLGDWFFQFPDVQRRFKSHVLLLMREIGNYAFSQLRVFEKLEKKMRQATILLMREGRHHQITFYFDLQRAIDLYKGVRVLCDHTHIKKSNTRMLPAELKWVTEEIKTKRERMDTKGGIHWREREEIYPKLSSMFPRQYYSLGTADKITPVRNFRMANFHHKRPEDRFEDITGIQFKRLRYEEEEYIMPPEVFEVIQGATLIREGVTYAALTRASPINTPYSTLETRIKRYNRTGQLPEPSSS